MRPERPRCCDSSQKRFVNCTVARHGEEQEHPAHAVLEVVRAPAAAAGGRGKRGDGAAEQGAVQEGGVRHPGLPLQEHVRLQEVRTPLFPKPEEFDCFVSLWVVGDFVPVDGMGAWGIFS